MRSIRPVVRVGCLPLAVGLGIAMLMLDACASAPDAQTGSADLINGRPEAEGEFPSTLLIAGNCTAAKIGPRHILTAGHCVLYNGSTTGTMYAPGATMHVTNKAAADSTNVNGPELIAVIVEQTYVNPTWVSEQQTGMNLGPKPSADVAIVVLTPASEAALAAIPSAVIDTAAVVPGDRLVIMGYGCETGLNAGFDYTQARLKVQATLAMNPADALAVGRTPAPNPAARIENNYFFTPGAGSVPDGGGASLCPGDSGGPVYRDDGTHHVIVGVNSYYNFDPTDAVGRSLTNWHTRLDKGATAGVEAWVRAVLNGSQGLQAEGPADAGAPPAEAGPEDAAPND